MRALVLSLLAMVAVPAACGAAPTCGCLADVPCGSYGCTGVSGGGFQLVCPGG